ncbi:hypothetical protein [Kribbella qitaiheensis]|uniref:hypothetical protein n=1 Tax=Kribbella qitaiheensis TaxID=1544730 RepID=UPI001FE98A66|nr:hypothetical protein [Kribbella qitaiheensis]
MDAGSAALIELDSVASCATASCWALVRRDSSTPSVTWLIITQPTRISTTVDISSVPVTIRAWIDRRQTSGQCFIGVRHKGCGWACQSIPAAVSSISVPRGSGSWSGFAACDPSSRPYSISPHPPCSRHRGP